MIYKLITFKLSFRCIASQTFISFYDLSNEDLNMKAKKARTFLYFLFLIFYLRYILVGIQLSNVRRLGTVQLRDCRQITFVMLNRFFLLSNPPPHSNPVLKRQYQNGQHTNQNQMKDTPSIYIVFQDLKVILV